MSVTRAPLPPSRKMCEGGNSPILRFIFEPEFQTNYTTLSDDARSHAPSLTGSGPVMIQLPFPLPLPQRISWHITNDIGLQHSRAEYEGATVVVGN